MAAQLIAIARATQPDIAIFAHTLPERNVSNRILAKLAFEFSGEVIHPEDGSVWEWRLPPASNQAIRLRPIQQQRDTNEAEITAEARHVFFG